MAISTQGVVLKICSKTVSGETVTYTKQKEISIKSFPDLGAAPAAIEVTTLADDVQKFIPGIKGMAAMEFVANYNADDFNWLVTNEKTDYVYVLNFGTKKYALEGKHNALIVGGGINAAVDMKIVVLPSSKVDEFTSTIA